jgi:hypothetical protein
VSGGSAHRSAVVLSASWQRPHSELAFVTRALAGAASRTGSVHVVTPTQSGTVKADGAFDLLGLGAAPGGGWPEPAAIRWPRPLEGQVAWIVDEPDQGARSLVDVFGNDQVAFSVARVPGGIGEPVRQLGLVGSAEGNGIGLHVPINPLAGGHRHMGLGFTGYILVLTDRSATPSVEPPTAAVSWLTSRFYDHHVVVVEGGAAAAWKGRALRGVVPVDTRTDLWRLLAHAQLTVDLEPGDVIARESIESLLFGTPIVVPTGTVAAAHTHAGGGLAFSDTRELFSGVEKLLDDSTRERFSREGSHYAKAVYGDPAGFTERLAAVLWPGV